MTETITNYKCPACTGPLRFSPDTGKTECEYCGSVYELAEIEALYSQRTEETSSAEKEKPDVQEMGQNADGMKTYSCPACTAELVCSDSTAASCCPYCGNPTVIPGQLSGTWEPDCIVPFKMEKDDAVAALKKHYSKRFFLPKSFSSQNHIQEIQGVYVPFWLFDGEAEGSAEFKATSSHTYIRGDYRIKETRHYSVYREGSVAFEKIPVDGSTRMPDGHMDSIEPFDYEELQPFSTAYLPGFLAEKYDISAEKSCERADIRCENTLIQELQNTVVGYDTVNRTDKNVRIHRGKARYALLPVWLLNTKWQGQDFLFAMNGQTGKMVGDLPVDKKKYWLTFLGAALGLWALIAAFLYLTALVSNPELWALVAGILGAFLICTILRGDMKNVYLGSEAGNYLSEPLNLTGQKDRYTHTTTTRTKIERQKKGN